MRCCSGFSIQSAPEPFRLTSGATVLIRFGWLLSLLVSACALKDKDHRLLVSVADQTMEVYYRNRVITRYPVSTSKFGLGDQPGTCDTPLGRLEIAKKVGAGAPLGAVFKDRKQTGEILLPDTPGRDPIVTRILWLKGLEPQNRNSFSRYIYIHGTPEERNIGRPASYGCIRMRSVDMIQLFQTVGVGAIVDITAEPLPTPAPRAAQTAAEIHGAERSSIAWRAGAQAPSPLPQTTTR